MKVIDFLETGALVLLDAASMLRRFRAVADKLEAKVSETKEREVTLEDQLIVRQARVETGSEFLWLREGGARDEVCMRLSLSPQQVAGILAGMTRNKERDGAEPEEVLSPPVVKPLERVDTVEASSPEEVTPHNAGAEARTEAPRAPRRRSAPPRPRKAGRQAAEASPPPPPAPPSVTLDPESWPTAREAKHGALAEPPRSKEYELDEEDHRIIPLLRQQVDDMQWPVARLRYCAHRRLTTQQVAGVLASEARRTPPSHSATT